MSETFVYDNLVAGNQRPLVNRSATIRVYEAFSRGTLLGRLTATGKWQVIAAAGVATCNDFGVATEAVDTTDGVEAVTSVYVEGEFNEDMVIYSYSNVASDWRELLTPHGIYLRTTVHTDGTDAAV